MPWWAYVAALVLFLLYLRRVGIIGLFYPLYLTRLGKWYFERGLAAAHAEGPHSFAPPHSNGGPLQVHVVPYSDDNYCYLIHDRVDNVGVVVDAGDAEAVADAMEAAGLDRIDAVLSTHKHWDHVCGNDGVVAAFPGTQVLAGEAVPSGTKMLVDGERVVFGTRIEVTARAVPCHTRGHMVYVVREAGRHDQPAWVFTGDSLFLAGVGRFFEGSAGEMHHALHDVIGSLPGDTLVFPGHEYTLANLEFAEAVEPNNAAVADRLEWARDKRRRGLATVPGRLDAEYNHNPFMRVHEEAVVAAVGGLGGVSTFAALRVAKNSGALLSAHQAGLNKAA